MTHRFQLKGNSYRLAVAVDYERQLLFIKWIGTHHDYNRIDVAKVKHAGKAHKK
jgi:mRNA interferase HigB